MGIFDPDEVITVYSLKQAIEDGALVEIFKNQMGSAVRASRSLRQLTCLKM